jgi:hypothetical protein
MGDGMEYVALFVAGGLGFVLGLLFRWWGLAGVGAFFYWADTSLEMPIENYEGPQWPFALFVTAPVVIGVGLGVLVARRAGRRSRLLLIPATVGIALVLIGVGLGDAERWDASGEHFWWVIFLMVGALILGVLARRALGSREQGAPNDA